MALHKKSRALVALDSVHRIRARDMTRSDVISTAALARWKRERLFLV